MGKPSKGKKSENLGKGMGPKSLLSVMNTYNAGGSPAVSTPSVVAPKPMLMPTPSHPSNGSTAGTILSLPVWLFALCLKICLNELRNLVKLACLVSLYALT
ncbi:hypothetical protein C1H46_013258 [Malus baccata]|uniref:Uncharacterized protein n=1 Tax=Malus baccata TaxID=106549 RepID=A0A540MQP3_MALBA|nr:hypothetical protein C1H46_013258 [Malus baccata]